MIKFIIGMIIGGYIIHINPNIVNDIIILQQIRGVKNYKSFSHRK